MAPDSSSLRSRFLASNPEGFFLSTELSEAERYLTTQGLLPRTGLLRRRPQLLQLERAGEGNMNCVLRARLSDDRSFIVKQSRPWVEKYPHLDAPAARAAAEARYYQLVGHLPALATASPKLLHYDGANQVLVLQDLGQTQDLTTAYAEPEVLTALVGDGSQTVLQALARYLSTLHQHFRAYPPARRVANKAMRALNHEHLFALPFRPNNELDLDAYHPDLTAAFAKTWDKSLQERATALGERYLDQQAPGTLLHGDFYPGSFLQGKDSESTERVYVIDPEFCFTGPAEFDVGVFIGHLHLCGADHLATAFLEAYAAPLDEQLWRGFAGVEILRRLVGVAQLPIHDTQDRAALLATGRSLMLA